MTREITYRKENAMKLLLATAFSVVMAMSGAAYAQDTGGSDDTTTGATQPDALGADKERGGGTTDSSNYLTGPNIQAFYTDETMTTLRPVPEIRTTYLALPETDRTSLVVACEKNDDVRFTDLCRNIGGF
jgi:hypothetical protein